QRIGNYVNDPFEDYVKIAASKEIQGYDKLASIKKVETTEGVIGYETTWMVQSFRGGGGPSESLPITYFQLPNSSFLVRFSLSKKEDLDIYEKMLTTLSFPVSKVQSTPTPTIDEKAAVEKGIKEALQAKYNSNTFVVSVSKIEGNYAKGGVSDEGGGGMWFGAKVNGVWKIVWDGN
ncbi:MAG: hypothetical protein M1365_07810, partial [Actinobacteria bacterium]|nr:hypothetical protein [Actinomycetota bacterium]